jgi:hypothetical protein
MPHSYYIPSIKKSHAIDYIATQIHNGGLGIVTRVDFAPLKNKINHAKLHSAFIHCDNDPAWERQELELVGKIQNGQSHRLNFFGSSEYWIILKARTVIPQTIMNTSQIVDKCTFLESKVLELENALTNANQILYQLVSGLYCPLKQDNIRQQLFALLPKDVKPLIVEAADTEYMWDNSPTTVQGMACERCIETLQLQVNEIQHNLTNNQRPETPPPPLIDGTDSDTDYAYNMNLELSTWE